MAIHIAAFATKMTASTIRCLTNMFLRIKVVDAEALRLHGVVIVSQVEIVVGGETLDDAQVMRFIT